MSKKLHFDVRDVPSCARLGLSGRKIWICFKALVLSWASWSLFTYLGWLAADPEGIAPVFESSRLLPLPSGIFWASWQSVALLVVGIVLIAVFMLSASLRTSRITFEQIRGDDFFSGRDAAAFARRHWRPVFTVPLALAVGLGIALACGLLLGLAGRIPVAGPVLLGIMAVPGWGASLLVVLAAVALLASVLLVPAIVACTKGDSFETVFELFSSVTAQPWRLVLYGFTALLTRVLAVLAFLAASSAAVGILAFGTSLAGGGNPYSLLQGGLRFLAPSLVGEYSGIVDILGLAGSGAPSMPALPSALMAASGAAIALVLVSYWFSSCSSAWTVIYLAIRRRKDGEDLLARADQEDLAEFERQYGQTTCPSGDSPAGSSRAGGEEVRGLQ